MMPLWVRAISSYPCFLGLVRSPSPKIARSTTQTCGSSTTRRLPPDKSR
jgi:hypothetical protein